MKFGNYSSVTIENNGYNMGVQVGNNTGNITINQDIPSNKIDELVQNIAEKIAEQQHNNLPHDNTPTKKKWFRADTGKEITPDELLTHGNITAQIDGNVARVESCLPDGKTIYAEFNIDGNEISNIVSEGFPQEYSIRIPTEIQIHMKSFQCKVKGCIYDAKYYELKFGGFLLSLYGVNDHKLRDVIAKAPAGMKIYVNPIIKEVTFIKSDVLNINSN